MIGLNDTGAIEHGPVEFRLMEVSGRQWPVYHGDDHTYDHRMIVVRGKLRGSLAHAKYGEPFQVVELDKDSPWLRRWPVGYDLGDESLDRAESPDRCL